MARFLSLCSCLLLLAGCSTSAALNIPSTPRHPHLLRWGIANTTDVPTLDPALASDPVSITLSTLVYGGLVRLDSHLRVQPDGAARWTIGRHGTVYTFHLRPNLRFPDGRRATATDFASALQRALGPEGQTGTASFYLGSITHRATRSGTVRGIAALNPSTLRITLQTPSAHFLSELAFPASYVPDPAILQRYGPNWTEHAAGFGPYFVRSWQHGRSMSLERNPYYYAGQPVLKRLSLTFYPQASDALAAYRKGAVDLVSGLAPGTAPPSRLSGAQRVPGLALDYLAFNTSHLPFWRLNARRAFAAAIPGSLAIHALGRSAFASKGFLPSALGLASTRWRPGRSPSAYLARARYGPARPLPAITMVVLRDPQLAALAHALADAWFHALHVTVTVRQLNPSNYGAVLDARAFDLALVRWGGDYADPQNFLGTQLGASPDNVTGWSPKGYNRDVALADSYAPDDRRRTSLLQRASAFASRKLPLIPLDEPAITALVRPGLKGVSVTPLGTVVGNWPRAGFVS